MTRWHLVSLYFFVFIFNCQIISVSESTPINDPNKNLMITVKAAGGLCSYGMCTSEKKIFKDGSFVFIDDTGDKKNGKVGYDLTRLIDIMEKTDFQSIRNHAFQGICPQAFDGTRFSYYFHTSHGVEDIDSCQHQIDEKHPLFKELSNVLGKEQ